MGAHRLYLAGSSGLHVIEPADGDWIVQRHTLAGRQVNAVAITQGALLAGTDKGIWRSDDGGRSWQPAILSAVHVRAMVALANAPSAVLMGTEPADIYLSRDRGLTWHHCPEVEELRKANGWFLPYSPQAGCVRGFAVAESGPCEGRIYAAVEVGGVLISDDGGRRWRLAEGSDGRPEMNRDLGAMIHPDVHAVWVHPSSSDHVTAATGGGLYRSTDGGRAWTCLYRCYIRAAWIDPQDARHLMAGPADGVSRNGRIEESTDGGKSWQPASSGMNAPWPRHMVERFYPSGGLLFAVLSNGELWLLPARQTGWRRVLTAVSGVKALAQSSLS
jgi:photosystem II stability/assembly factor-like uncharacterized protein